ncbi:hypothetical protein CQZ99_12255 [Pseudomonas poae]|uniref:Peptidase C58 YopT-type domain-containing protein n=2 Tax=Pseudomonas poae TaxID=200451 RepID=A0A2S9ETI9_9PSED|nr:hypothetical protein CQZ97_16785 [Pseudomonas poae]PRC19074.1 hypothetical protein CQZ99_12255 [Pseudomonas poae]
MGDQELALEYRAALQSHSTHGGDGKITVTPASTFGQWWQQLRNAFQSPEIREWIKEKGINPQSITLNAVSGQISFTLMRHLDPKQVLHTVGQNDTAWAAISEPILQAGKVIAAGHGNTAFAPPTTLLDEPVPWRLIGQFYGEKTDLPKASMLARAKEITATQGFIPLDPATSAGLIKSRSVDALDNQKALLGDIFDRHQIIVELRNLAQDVEKETKDGAPLEDELNKRMVDLSADGTFQASNTGKHKQASLLQLIKDHGWDIPTDHEQLVNLAEALSYQVPKTPANGNLGGALSWPTALDQNSQAQLRADLREGKFGDVALSPFNTVLDYLLNGRAMTPEEKSNPRQLLDTLIDSPRGKALGNAIQAKFETRGIKGSANDWLLTALNLESSSVSSDGAKSPPPGEIEGYRLVSAQNIGKSASTILKELSDHLVAKGKASSPEKAAIQARLLLSSQAPEFLVKDIPAPVSIGTHSWVSFVTATARIEAKSPGATAAMTYAQIMLAGDTAPITDDERSVEYVAQDEAIKQWGVANGMSYPATEEASSKVREAFSAQILELKEAAEADIPEMPTTKDLALEQLKKVFPKMDPALFEKKCIVSKPSSQHFPGPYSILDLYIDGRALQGAPDASSYPRQLGRRFVYEITAQKVDIGSGNKPATWDSWSNQINIDDVLKTIKDLPRPLEAFEEAFPRFASAVEKTTSAQLKLLISKLPLEDRQNLELGKLTIRREIKNRRGDLPQRAVEGALLVETERNGKRMTYEINRLKGTITQRPDKTYEEHPSPNGLVRRVGKQYDVIVPVGSYSPGVADEVKSTPGAFNSFSSARTQYIVDAMITDIDLPSIKQYAQGATTFDTEVPLYKTFEKVVLNLIPFRSAIKNFIDGNVGEGIADLAFDIFGFAVGLGPAAKGAKVLAAGASTSAKVARAGKIIGRAAIGALNPVSGIDDVGRGLLNAGRKALGKTYKGFKYLRGSHKNVNLLELAKRPDIAEGSYKPINSTAESKALAQRDEKTKKWYAFDPNTKQPYGKALENFAPEEIKWFADSSFGKMVASYLAPAANNPKFREDYLSAITRAKAEDNAAYIRGMNTGKPESIYGYSTALNIDGVKRLAVAERRTPEEIGSLARRIDELDVLPERLKTAQQTAQAVDEVAYKKGYEAGDPANIPGFSKKLNTQQLAELAVAKGRSAEDTGRLIKYMEQKRINISRENFMVFSNEVTAAGGKVISLPQGYYLSQASVLSEGECAALSNVMAAAIKHGKQHNFVANIYRSMVPTLSPEEIAALRKVDPVKAGAEQLRATKITKFREQLHQLQKVLGAHFHHGMQARQVPYTTIISELASSNSSKTLLINGPQHGITAGVTVKNGSKEWFYFDPNFGIATYSTEAGMRAGLESTLNSGRSRTLLAHYGDKSSMPEYKISTFNEVELNNVTRSVPGEVSDLFMSEF